MSASLDFPHSDAISELYHKNRQACLQLTSIPVYDVGQALTPAGGI